MDLRDYKIAGKSLKDMSDDELKEHFARLRGARATQDESPSPRRRSSAPKSPAAAPLDAEEI